MPYRRRLVISILRVLDLLLGHLDLLLNAWINSDHCNLVLSRYEESVRLLNAAADRVRRYLQILHVHDIWDASADIKGKDVQVAFRGCDNVGHGATVLVLHFDHLHDLGGHLV